jgi:hypothetical protein
MAKFLLPAVLVLLAAIAGGFYWRKHQTVQPTDKDQLIWPTSPIRPVTQPSIRR